MGRGIAYIAPPPVRCTKIRRRIAPMKWVDIEDGWYYSPPYYSPRRRVSGIE